MGGGGHTSTCGALDLQLHICANAAQFSTNVAVRLKTFDHFPQDLLPVMMRAAMPKPQRKGRTKLLADAARSQKRPVTSAKQMMAPVRLS